MKILILTVGGSHQPLLKAIEQTRPDAIHFICSDDGDQGRPGSYHQVIGKGKVLRGKPPTVPPTAPDLPNLATLAGLEPSRFHIYKIARPDNLDDCFRSTAELIEAIRKAHPSADILVDYTGGTKSMTAGLTAAALNDGRCMFQLVTGRRDDLRQVTDGTEFVRSVRVEEVQMRRAFTQANELLLRFDYIGAARLLETAAEQNYNDVAHAAFQRSLDLARAFDAWDRFEHEKARSLLQGYKADFHEHHAHLSLHLEGKGHGWELVEDLLLNAERRAKQERYDDAAGRLYRALELTVQVWLRKCHGIETGTVNLAKVPDVSRKRLAGLATGSGKVQIGLLAAWDLLKDWPEDVLAPLFEPKRGAFLKHLETRNDSLFAHGEEPVSKLDFEAFNSFCTGFIPACINTALSALNFRRRNQPLMQFPTSFSQPSNTKPTSAQHHHE